MKKHVASVTARKGRDEPLSAEEVTARQQDEMKADAERVAQEAAATKKAARDAAIQALLDAQLAEAATKPSAPEAVLRYIAEKNP